MANPTPSAANTTNGTPPAQSRTTRAVVIPRAGEIGLQTVKLAEPGPRAVIVETVFTSISAGTERMLLAGQLPHPMLEFPVVPGYETVGRVVEVGADVAPEWLGRWVFLGGTHCFQDVNPAWGGQSATLFAKVDRVVPLDGVEPVHGVLLSLAATALHGVDRLNVTAGQRILVLGQGPVGQIAARLAAQRGAWVAVTDRVPSRLARAQADLIINAGETDVAKAVDGPVDGIIEATGSMEALAQALPALKLGGAILLLGFYQTLQLPYMPLFLKEAELLTAKEWAPGDLMRCRDLLADGSLDVAPLLTHRMPVDDVVAAYDVALQDQDCLKLVLDWK